jgi:3-oxoacyl-[acyl-carrier protein] reductase
MRETYVITGASRGIGAYLAEYYDRKDKFVIRASRSNGFDITNDEDIEVLASLGTTIDVLINCAGIGAMNAAAFIPSHTVRNIVDTNLVGTHNVCTALFPKMRHTTARIINFSSVAASLALHGEGIYAASKAGVEVLTKVLAKEWAPWGITVNCIAPNPIKTDLIRGVPQPLLDKLINEQAIKRYGTMEDVANICDFFINPRSEFITGQVIRMGGT